MSKTFTNFVFSGYHFDNDAKTLTLRYAFDDQLQFSETYRFDFPFVTYDLAVLNQAIQNLFFMAGVSYYKAYPSEHIRIDHGRLDKSGVAFFSEVYQKGLGEYFYINKLDPNTEIPFIANAPDISPRRTQNNTGTIVGLGGGKDSLLSAELLRGQPRIATWSLDHREQMEPLVKRVGLPHLWVERVIDPLLLELNNQDALNGHVPLSAILSCVGTIVCILAGYRDNIVSNEYSTNEPTLSYDGVDINHQYSKSSAYEEAYQQYLAHCFGDNLRYYSFLRPLSEVHIAKLFAEQAFAKYKDVFSSCNRAYVHSSTSMSWCGVCSKCAFVFLALTPFVDRVELEKLWRKNLLLDPTLVTTYENILGISGEKPLDCVGEIKESRTAMLMAQAQYPGLAYEFDVPTDYDYLALAPHAMPEEMFAILEAAVATES